MDKTSRTSPTFDPRHAPVVRVDLQLAAVSDSVLAPDALRKRFMSPPIWSPELRVEPLFSDRKPAFASVLIPIVLREQPMVLLTQRTAHLSSHSGQIAFPGGKVDASDVDAVATALREAQEEVGLDPAAVEVLGALPSYVTGTAFVVTPVVGLVSPRVQLALNSDEVAHVFEVPLAFLMNPSNHRRHRVEWEGIIREWYSMPYAEPDAEWFIWGATAGMLRNLYHFLRA